MGVHGRLVMWRSVAWVTASLMATQASAYALVGASSLVEPERVQTLSAVSGVYILEVALGIFLVVVFRLVVIMIDRFALG